MPGNLNSVPESVIASWPAPNYIDPHRREGVVPLASVLQAVMTLMVGTRLWLRATNKAGSLGLDDALLVPAFLAATMFNSLIILSNERYGTDRHIWDVPTYLYQYTTLTAWLSEFAFLISTTCTKVSVLLFYRRLVKGTFSKRWKTATIGAIVLTCLYCLAFILALLLTCNPTEAYWKSQSPTYTTKYTCTDTEIANPIAGAYSVFSDLYSVLLPMGMLRHFDAPKRQKIALNAMFALGLLVVGAGIARTYYLYWLGVKYDITWDGYDVYIWSCLECDLSIIFASAPALRVFFRTYLSDPMTRMMHTAKSATSTRNTNRDSRQTDNGIVVSSPHARTSSKGSSDFGDKRLIQHQIKPSLDTVGETDLESAGSSAPSEQYTIKTPADFEAYALQNLERHRPPPTRMNVTRPLSDEETDEMRNGPFTDWHSIPKSRG